MPENDQIIPQETVIESASATTSPDNSNSGSAAYVIFGVAVALVALIAIGFSGCVSALGRLALDNHSYGYGHNYDYDGQDIDDQLEDLYYDLDDYINDLGRETDQS